jgi:alginate O-acetyltransferase complex protein AlgI
MGSSVYFYMSWNPYYLILILISTLITYYTGIKISDINEKEINEGSVRAKKIWLIGSLVSNLFILFVFKYLGFLNEIVSSIMKGFDSDWSYLNFKLLLPVGISFYTFQALSYSMDIYRNELKAERHFGKYALFVSFFPQLVAGPIERSTSLLPQLQTRKKFDWLQARDGVLLILWGLIKKMVIADRLAVFVNEVYTEPTLYTGDDLLIATVFFSFQIYLDFSSYSDIAIGSAQVLGINLMTNFRRPYFATSIPDFWRRWHISLSTWFRDYLYFPLGGNRTSYIKWLRNILIVFLVSGLWHGASWNFVIWGAIHGIIQISSIVTKRFRENIKRKLNINDKSFGHKLFQIGLTFSIVTFAWIFFRAETFEDSIYIIKNLFVNTGDIILLGQNSAIKDISLIDLKFGVLLIIILLIIQAIQSRLRIRDFIYKQSLFFRWSVYSMMILVIVIFGVYGDGTVQEFIYFQF